MSEELLPQIALLKEPTIDVDEEPVADLIENENDLNEKQPETIMWIVGISLVIIGLGVMISMCVKRNKDA